jgi:hypothetical protein
LAYGQCVLATYQDVRKDMCAAEFSEFKQCVQVAVSFSNFLLENVLMISCQDGAQMVAATLAQIRTDDYPTRCSIWAIPDMKVRLIQKSALYYLRIQIKYILCIVRIWAGQSDHLRPPKRLTGVLRLSDNQVYSPRPDV